MCILTHQCEMCVRTHQDGEWGLAPPNPYLRPKSIPMQTQLIYLWTLWLLGACAGQPAPVPERTDSPAPVQLRADVWYPVSKLVDGDTFWIDDGTDKGAKIRLIGVDAPETRNAGNKQKHPMGKEVAAYVAGLLQGAQVRLELDVQHRDRYGRILAYVYLPDGTFLNAHLVEKGYAVLMTMPPNVRYADTFYQLQVQAREAGRGLWR